MQTLAFSRTLRARDIVIEALDADTLQLSLVVVTGGDNDDGEAEPERILGVQSFKLDREVVEMMLATPVADPFARPGHVFGVNWSNPGAPKQVKLPRASNANRDATEFPEAAE